MTNVTEHRSASEQITDEVGVWPGVEVDTGELGEVAFKVSGREIGHVHGDRAADFSFPRDKWDELHAEGRIEHHPVFPDARGPGVRQDRRRHRRPRRHRAVPLQLRPRGRPARHPAAERRVIRAEHAVTQASSSSAFATTRSTTCAAGAIACTAPTPSPA